MPVCLRSVIKLARFRYTARRNDFCSFGELRKMRPRFFLLRKEIYV